MDDTLLPKEKPLRSAGRFFLGRRLDGDIRVPLRALYVDGVEALRSLGYLEGNRV